MLRNMNKQKRLVVLLTYFLPLGLTSLAGQLAPSTERPAPVERLPAHLAESGLVTQKEDLLAQSWFLEVTAVKPSAAWLDGWLSTKLPFSFRYGGRDFADPQNQWLRENKVNPLAKERDRTRYRHFFCCTAWS